MDSSTGAAPGLRERLGSAVFAWVAGPAGPENRARIHGTPGPRWFGPDRPIRTVHGDASMFIGGLRALLLQSLHPLAMAAVEAHSGYRGDPWGRPPAHQHLPRRDHVRDSGPRTAGGRPGSCRARLGARNDPRGRALRRLRSPPSRLGARGRGRELPARPPALRCRAARRHAATTVTSPTPHMWRRPSASSILRAAGRSSSPGSVRTALNCAPRERHARRHASSCCTRRCPGPPAHPMRSSPRTRLAALPRWARTSLDLPRLSGVGEACVTPTGRALTTAIRWAMAPARQASRSAAPG